MENSFERPARLAEPGVVSTTVIEGGSFKFSTFVLIVAGLIIPLWPISLPLCWFLAYRSYQKPSAQVIRTYSN